MTPLNLRSVVSNTGPLISALQSDCMYILLQFYDRIHIPAEELWEYQKHGAGMEVQALTNAGILIVHRDITEIENEAARIIAQEISDNHATPRIETQHTIYLSR